MARSKPISGTEPGRRHFEQVKEQYRASLKQLKLQKARQVYADSLRAKIDVAVLLRPPSVNVAYDPARVKGIPKPDHDRRVLGLSMSLLQEERKHFA